jgi:hypothetical protein
MAKRILLLLLVCFTAFAQITNVNLGTTINDGTGDTLRTAFSKVNTNITWLASQLAYVTNLGSFRLVPSFSEAVVSVSSPSAYQVFQRSSDNSGTITVTATVSGPTGTTVQARFKGGSWQTVGTSSIYGVATGTITGTMGQGAVDVRISGGSTYTTVTPVSIGDVFAIWGQSNGSGRLTSNQTFTNTAIVASIFGNDYTWKAIVYPTDSNSGQVDTVSSDSDSQMGSIWPLVADIYINETAVPVAFVQCTKGATGFSGSPSWVPGSDHFDRTTLFGSAMNRIRTVGGVKAILWWQGEGGFDDTTGMSYITPFTNMVTAVREEYPTLRLVPCKLQQCVGITNERLTNGWYAIGRLWSEWTNLVYTGPTLADAPVGAANNILTEDEGTGTPYYHLKTSTNGAAAAYRWATNLVANFE